MKIFSYPLAMIFKLITKVRNFLYDKNFLSIYKSNLPVISIGNISVGGSGKTPLALYVVQLLLAKGKKPVVLMRGYGGKLKGPHLVEEGDSFLDVGDEALLIKKLSGCPVVIARKRSEGAQLIEKSNLGDIIVLDDGFQHRALYRNLDIVCVNASEDSVTDSFIHNKLLPYGLLREDCKDALKRATVFLLTLRKPAALMKQEPKEILSILPPNKPVFMSFFEVDGVLNGVSREKLAPCEIVAFCGIANPDAFFSSLEYLGYKVVSKFIFADHYMFSQDDIDRLFTSAERRPLVCTEKDFVRLNITDCQNVYVLVGHCKIVPAEQFEGVIMQVV
jgi:tetraacyldisaccharide 4'-kinase